VINYTEACSTNSCRFFAFKPYNCVFVILLKSIFERIPEGSFLLYFAGVHVILGGKLGG